VIPIDTSVSNPKLLTRIDAFRASFSVENEVALFRELQQAQFLSRVEFSENPDKTTKTTFLSIGNEDGTQSLPVFTSISEFRDWAFDSEGELIVVPFADIYTVAFQNSNCRSVIIDPGGRNLAVTETMVNYLFNLPPPQRSAYSALPTDIPVSISTPIDYPHEMVRAVSKYLKKQKPIKRAYLIHQQYENEESLLIALDFNPNANFDYLRNMSKIVRQAYSDVYDIAKPLIRQDMTLLLIEYSNPFINLALKERIAKLRPFYRKKFLGIF
jgi:hypothetical protein